MSERTLTFGRYRLEPQGGLMSGGRNVHLTPKALALLSFHCRPPRRGDHQGSAIRRGLA